MEPAPMTPMPSLAGDGEGDLASLLRGTMEARGWSASQMAAYLGTDRRTLFQWLAGRKPSKALHTALRLALSAGPGAEVMLHLQAALRAVQPASQGTTGHKGGGGAGVPAGSVVGPTARATPAPPPPASPSPAAIAAALARARNKP